MAIGYEKVKGHFLDGDVVWVDEPEDLYGDGPLVEQQRRHAAEVIKRMDSSKKWRRIPTHDEAAIMMVVGPDGATTADGTPYADAVGEAMRDGARSAQLVTDEETGGGSVIASYPDGSKKTHEIPPPKKPTQADVRKWAVEQGIDVNPMGQIPKKLIEQYIEAHGG